MGECGTGQSPDLERLLIAQGERTRIVLSDLHASKPLSASEAQNQLLSETPPFCERFSQFLSRHYGVEDDLKEVKACLRKAGKEKHLGFSSANLSQWLSGSKWEQNLDARSLFKLCLAMGLSVEKGRVFTYDCLHQTWLNYRIAEDAVYLFFLEHQELFGNETYALACEVIEWSKGHELDASEVASGEGDHSAAGYTRLIGREISALSREASSQTQAIDGIKQYLLRNRRAFSGIRQSAVQTYNTYFSEGGIGITPLTELYKDAEGLTLPRSGYLDGSYIQETPNRKRLLWGTANRADWIENNGRDVDILNRRDILIEQHSVGKMPKRGVPRGNIIALLFFHYCLEKRREFLRSDNRSGLFDEFYERVNTTLVDECGMMPLHPRKPFDAIFLKSISSYPAGSNPIVYLNQMLEDFYAR